MATCYGRLYICTSRPQQGMAPGLFVSAALSRGTLRSLVHSFAGPTTGAHLFWDAFEPDPAHRARFQVRWSASEDDIDAHPFVGPDGTPRDFVVKGERPPGLGFGDAAIAALQQVRFKPGKQRDRFVPVRMSQPIKFQLN